MKQVEIISPRNLTGSQILTHVRCHMDDAKVAVETGVDGVLETLAPFHQRMVVLRYRVRDVVIGTSSFLREHSHGWW